MAFHTQSVLINVLTQSNFPSLLYNFLLPFVFVFLILYSVIRLLRIFNNKISGIISLVITLFFANTEAFVAFTTAMSQFTGGFAVAIFFALFLFGIVSYAIGRGKQWEQEFGTAEDKVKNLNKKIAKLQEKLDQADTDEEKDEINETIEKLEKARDRLVRRESR